MRDRLIELLNEATFGVNVHTLADHLKKETIEAVADYLIANGVIVPPCKVGDTLWVNWENYNGKKETRPVKVYALRFDTKKNSMRICVEGDFEISSYGGSYTHYYNGTFAWNSVGKTVFLTREEAEQTLKGGGEG